METFVFQEKYSYPYNQILKAHGGKFDPKTKEWNVPLENKLRLYSAKQQVDRVLKEKAEKNWGLACEEVGVRFAKKGTEDYDLVMVAFKRIMQNN